MSRTCSPSVRSGASALTQMLSSAWSPFAVVVAGTTANDALWVGLPVLTRCGKSFAARMAGALLTAAGMDELITYDVADYEEKAVSIASDPATLLRLRAQLQQVRKDGVLFDTPRFVRNLEGEFKRLVSAL